MDYNEFKQYQTADIYRQSKPNLKTIVYRANEIFANSPIFPEYLIGNYGTVYNIKTGFQANPRLDKDGYLSVSVKDGIGKSHSIGVHRLVMLAHCPIDNYPSMQVNHKDGNKLNNYYHPTDPLSNLEWCTSRENVQHAVRTGLNKGTVRTEDQVRAICDVLQRGGSTEEALLAAGLESTIQTKGLVWDIRGRRVWTDVSADYDIPLPNTPDTHSEEEVRLVCELLMNGLTDKEVASKMGEIGYHTKAGFIHEIRTQRGWPHISTQYTFPHKNVPYTFTDEEIHLMCRLLSNRVPYSTVIKRLQIDLSVHPYGSITALFRSLQNNTIKKYEHISRLYFR